MYNLCFSLATNEKTIVVLRRALPLDEFFSDRVFFIYKHNVQIKNNKILSREINKAVF